MAQSTPIPDTSKRCTKCDEVKTFDEFHRSSYTKDGRRYVCKECRKPGTREERDRLAALHAKGKKSCSRCGEAKELAEFGLSKTGKFGRMARCKACKASTDKDYRAANLDAIKATKAAHYRANRDEICAKVKTYREANREKVAATSLKHYQANRDRYRKYYAEYYAKNADRLKKAASEWGAAHPDKVIAYTNARRARERQGEYDNAVTVKALRERDGDRCCYCQVPLRFCGESPDRVNLEHILPVSRGGSHTFDNTALACRACNLTKHTRLFIWEWVPPFPTAAA